MPQHTFHSGLLRLYYTFPTPGAPWNWEAWKTITGVQHGLFSSDDTKLPKGWTREMANAIHAYFEAYRAHTNETDRLNFTSSKAADNFVGRDYWRTWVRDFWPVWRIQLRIQKAFEDCSIMPFQIMVGNDLTEVPESLPISDAYDRIAYNLFGEDGLDHNAKIKLLLRDCVNIFGWRASQNIRGQASRLITRMKDKESKIVAIFDGTIAPFRLLNSLLTFRTSGLASTPPTTSVIAELVKLVSLWRKDILIYDSQDNLLRLAYVEVELQEIRKALGAFVEEDPVANANALVPAGAERESVSVSRHRTLLSCSY